MKRIALLACSLIGYLLGRYLPPGAWSAYAPMLISYHLYLGWLVLTADHEVGFSLPVFQTILTHSAFLAALIGLAVGRHYVPFFGLIRIFIPALAPFETKWLFGGSAQKMAAEEVSASQTTAAAPVAVSTVGASDVPSTDVASTTAALTSAVSTTVMAPATSAAAAPRAIQTGDEGEYTADEHTAWIRYLGRPRRAFRKPGLSVGDEFKLWQKARAQYRAMLAQNQNAGGEVAGQV